MKSNNKFENIEVAVRLRPLNQKEKDAAEESAWEIKQGGGLFNHRDSLRQKHGDSRRSMEVLAEGQGRVIQLKNKYRFGLENGDQSDMKKEPRSKSAITASNQKKMNTVKKRQASVSRNFTPSQKLYSTNGNLKFDQSGDVSDFNLRTVGKISNFGERMMEMERTKGRNDNGMRAKTLSKTPCKQVTKYMKPSNSFKRCLTARKSQTNISSSGNLGYLSMRKDKRPSGRDQYQTQNAKKARQTQYKFDYDLVYGERDSNRDIYEQTVRKVVLASLEGINGTVFVYGQTGTGKTYTMMGNRRTIDDRGKTNKPDSYRNQNPNATGTLKFLDDQKHLYDAYENSGVLLFSMQDLFDKIGQLENHNQERQFTIKLSYIEIYNEMIFDLLSYDKTNLHDQVLSIHEDKQKNLIVKGANEINVTTINEVLQLIKYGEKNRHYAETFLNHCSSRSHTLFRLQINSVVKQNEKYLQTSSYLNFVDLAGSEKITNYISNGGTGPDQQQIRLKEGLSINKSLFYLTQVIHLLSQKTSKHVPYRNSSLTKILKSSLCGNSRTSIIVCVTPASLFIDETINSLKFGKKAMKVQQSAKAQINEIKHSAIKARPGLNHRGSLAQNDHVIAEVVQDYEDKILALEKQVSNNTHVKQLMDQVNDLQTDRSRLIQAVELLGDRSYFTKQLYQNQKKGFQVLSLRHAGDVAIQTTDQSIMNVEQLLEQRDQKLVDLQLVTKSCNQMVNQISHDNKILVDQNLDLREECERLEQAYKDIISEFQNMSSMQQEIIEMATREQEEKMAPVVDQDLMANFDQMNDRELARLDHRLQDKQFKVKEEREKRTRHRKQDSNRSNHKRSQSLGSRGSGSPYKQITFLSKTSSKPDSPMKCSPQKFILPNYTVEENPYEPQISTDRQEGEKQGRSKSDKLLHGTFGEGGAPKPATNTVHTSGNYASITSVMPQNQGPFIEQIGGIHIDKSLYVQDNAQKGPLRDKQTSHRKSQVSERQTSRFQQEENYKEDYPIPFEDLANPANWMQNQFDVIKEEVQNENNPSSFDNLSNSVGFDISAHNLPGFQGAPSLNTLSQNQNVINLSNYNSALSGLQHDGSATSSDIRRKLQGLQVSENIQPQHAKRSSLFIETPKTPIQLPGLQNAEVTCRLTLQGSQNVSVFDKSLSDLSQAYYKQQMNLTQEDKNRTPRQQEKTLHDELYLEFQMEQRMARKLSNKSPINLGTNQNKSTVKKTPILTKKNVDKKDSSPVLNTRNINMLGNMRSNDKVPSPISSQVNYASKTNSKFNSYNNSKQNSQKRRTKPIIERLVGQKAGGSNNISQRKKSNTSQTSNNKSPAVSQKNLAVTTQQKSFSSVIINNSQSNSANNISSNNFEEMNIGKFREPGGEPQACPSSLISYEPSCKVSPVCTTTNRGVKRKPRNFEVDLRSPDKENAPMPNYQQPQYLQQCQQLLVDEPVFKGTANFEDAQYLQSIHGCETLVEKQQQNYYMQQIGKRQHTEESSDTMQTPYGLIEVCDDNFSESTIMNNQNNIQQDAQFQKFLNQNVKSSTPSYIGTTNNDQFFSHEFENGEFLGNGYDPRILPSKPVSSIDLESARQKSSQQSQSIQSGSRSFKPSMGREIRKLERQTQQLQQHQEQYQQYFNDFMQQANPEDPPTKLSQMSLLDNSVRDSYQELDDVETVRVQLHLNEKAKVGKTNESFMSNSTSQYTGHSNNIDQNKTGQTSRRAMTNVEDISTSMVTIALDRSAMARASHDFATSKKSHRSHKSANLKSKESARSSKSFTNLNKKPQDVQHKSLNINSLSTVMKKKNSQFITTAMNEKSPTINHTILRDLSPQFKVKKFQPIQLQKKRPSALIGGQSREGRKTPILGRNSSKI